MKPVAADATPYLDIARPGFSIKSDEVYAARERSWYARTSYGLAILRHEQVSRLLSHPKLRQGSFAWPAHNGVTGGPFVRWFLSWVLNKEGDDHRRLRRLMNPASAWPWACGSGRTCRGSSGRSTACSATPTR